MPDRRDYFSLPEELDRMSRARRGEIILQAEWGHDDRGYLTGALGEFLYKWVIQARFNPGKPSKQRPEDGQSIPKSIRWWVLSTLASGRLPLETIISERSVCYREPLQVDGSLVDLTGDLWKWVRERAALDEVLVLKQAYVLAGVSCVVRPCMEPFKPGVYYPVGLAVVPSSECIGVRNPANPSTLGLYLEPFQAKNIRGTLTSFVRVWDCMDPEAPYFGIWNSIQDWQAYRPPRYPLMYGVAWPSWSGIPGQSEPIMPCIPCSFNDVSSAKQPLPVASSEHEAMLNLATKRCKHELVQHGGSFNRAFLLSEGKIDGLEEIVLNPGIITSLSGSGQKSMELVPHSLDAAEKLAADIAQDELAIARKFDPDFGIQKTQSESGVALQLRMNGKDQLFKRLEHAFNPQDQRIVESLAMAHNYLVRSGQLSLRIEAGRIHWTPSLEPASDPAFLLDVSDVRVRQIPSWTALERKEIREELKGKVDDHLESPEALWLFDNGMLDTSANRLIARDAIMANLETTMAYAAKGYGLEWRRLNEISASTAEDETALYTAPDDVGVTAAKGLSLNSSFPGRGLVGVDASTRKLRQRARDLANNEAMTIGQVRELDAWHKAHVNDSAKPVEIGQWGNDENPSGPYIIYLSQGGDAARAWLPIALTPATEVQP